jgi:hypothetical protein
MVLPSSGVISVNDFATEYEIGTGSPVGFDRIKTISTNWSGTSIGMDQLYSLDRDDLVGNSATTKSVTGSGASFSTFAERYIMTFRVAVGLSATVDGNIVNTGNVNSQGVAIYTWNGTLYARAGDGNISNSGDAEVSFAIPSGWTTSQIRVVVVTFCTNESFLKDQHGQNLLVVDGILRDQSTSVRFQRVTSSSEGGKTGQVNTPGYGVYTRMSNNELAYEAPSAIISAQVWYDRLGYIPGYNTAGSSKGNYFIYENSNAYIVFTERSSRTFGLYDIGPNTRPAVRYLMVGGGGGSGGNRQLGGGGGGGILFDDTGVTLASGTYTVSVGDGGSRDNPGDNGDNTTFHTYTALGGGGGGSISAKFTHPGQNGGTGGGGGADEDGSTTTVGGTGSQGGDGGDGSIYSGDGYGGGGGGGGASGQDGMQGQTSGKPVRPWGSGGNGTQYPWGHLGETATYYGGGGAGWDSDATERALGGGGVDGGDEDGEDVYGGGGSNNGDGGSGNVTIRLPWTIPTS